LVYPADLNDAAPARVAGYLQQRAAKPRKDGGLSQQTAAFHLAAVRRFVWWLSERKRVPVRAALLDSVPGFDPAGERVHARRELPPGDLDRVLDAARTSPTVRGLTGEARYHLYVAAFGSGFRVSELAALRPEIFALDADPPAVELPAKAAKNKKPVRQSLPPWVAAVLRSYVAARPAGQPVWPGRWVKHAAKMIRKDLDRAGVPYVVHGPHGPEYADFHALRHSFASALAAAGVGVKDLQTLARHGDARLTLSVYTHSRREEIGRAAAKLPMPASVTPGPFAGLSREQLEDLLGAAVCLFAVLFAGQVQAGVQTRSDQIRNRLPHNNL
jgi:integrase